MKKSITFLLIFSFLAGYSYLCGSSEVSNAESDQKQESSVSFPEASEGTDPIRVKFQYLLTRGREEVLKREPYFEYVPDMIGFDIQDITGDGQEDLIIRRKDNSTIYIADPNTNSFENALGQFSDKTVFYANGTVAERITASSHGLDGNFKPYTVYIFDAAKNQFILHGSVEAWEKETNPTDGNGNPYPDDIDKSASGKVYYISGSGYNEKTPVDSSVYEKWRTGWRNGAAQIKPEYQDLTPENIKNIDVSAKPPVSSSVTSAPAPVTSVTSASTASSTSAGKPVTTAVTSAVKPVTTTGKPVTNTGSAVTSAVKPVTTTEKPVTAPPAVTSAGTTAVSSVSSAAETVISSNVSVTAAVTLPGFSSDEYDINCDGMITSADLIRLIQIITNPEKFNTPAIKGDINSDGKVNAADIMKMKNFLR